jgi:hypothetical protein
MLTACIVRGTRPDGTGADLRRSRVTDGHVSSGRSSFSTFLTNDKARRGAALVASSLS